MTSETFSHHHQAGAAGDLGGDGVHQDRGWVGGGAAGHVQAGGLDGGPARAEFDAKGVCEAIVLRQLAAVIGFDAVARELQCRQGLRITRLLRGVDLGGGDAQAGLGQIDAVELAAVVDERRVAARHDIGDDRAHGLLDVERGLALRVQEDAETGGEIRSLAVELLRHHGGPAGTARPFRLNG